MNRRELAFGVTAAALVAAGNATAQSAFGSAPPPDPTDSVYLDLNDQISRAPTTARADLRRFYELAGWRPVWTAPRLRLLGPIAARAERHGLSGADFFDFAGLAADPVSSEVRTSMAALGYARVLAEGRVRPETVEDLWEMQKNRVDLPAGLHEALNRNTLADWFEALAPTDIGYSNLSAGYVRYRQLIAEGGWPAFAQGANIEPDGHDRRVPALRARLIAEGDLGAGQRQAPAGADGQPPSDTLYSPELVEAVRGFQLRHGLAVDGRIGAATQRALAVSAHDRARQIALNLERRRWLKRELAPERIEVNTAAAIMVYWKDGRPVHSNRVIVGTARNQTPSLEKPFASLVANPPWYVPASIARTEIIPRGQAYMQSRGMYFGPAGNVIQRAGPSAALGYVKFELHDSHAIFLHDTPTRNLFAGSARHLSHGCVRVHNAIDFARLLLAPDPTRLSQFDAHLDSRQTRRVTIGREITVRLLYWTAFVDGQGRVAFREDVYNRDTRLARALGIHINLPAPLQTEAGDIGP